MNCSHHSGMQHKNKSNSHAGHVGMPMYFNMSNPFYLFFKDILIASWGTRISGAVVLFFLTVAYEGLKTYREILFYNNIRKSRKRTVNDDDSNPTPFLSNNINIPCNGVSGDTEIIQPSSQYNFKAFAHRRFNKHHILQTFLHLLQTFFSYLLMLAFMTFNVWICLSILLGSMTGYFLFGWRKSLILDNLDHCH